MHFTKIKFGNSFLILILLYFLGYTHFLGGPYGIAKFFFILILVGTLLFSIFVAGMSIFAGRIFQKRMKIFNNKTEKNDKETIKVDAKVIE